MTLVRRGWKAFPDFQAQLDQQEREDHLDHLDNEDSKGCQVKLVNLESQERTDKLVCQVSLA